MNFPRPGQDFSDRAKSRCLLPAPAPMLGIHLIGGPPARAAPPVSRMIFITGATSHTGARLVRRLLAQDGGEEIRCLVRDEAQARARLETITGCKLPARCRLVEGDIEALESFAAAMQGARAVVNVAHMRYGPALAEAAQRAGAGRLVCLSSTRRYTQWPDTAARDVIAAEAALERSPHDWTILRATMIYGGPDDNNIEKILRAVRRWPALPLPGGGRNLVQPVFVGDLVEAIIVATTIPAASHRAYIAAGPEAMEYRAMIRTVAKAAGRRVVLVPVPLTPAFWIASAARALHLPLPVHPDQVRRLGEDKAFDIADAVRDLGFAPRTFADGLREKIARRV